jgi:hypothetical protein
MQGPESLGQRRGLEEGPPGPLRRYVVYGNDSSGPVTVHARTRASLELEDFHELTFLARGGHDLEVSGRIDKYESCRGGVKNAD